MPPPSPHAVLRPPALPPAPSLSPKLPFLSLTSRNKIHSPFPHKNPHLRFSLSPSTSHHRRRLLLPLARCSAASVAEASSPAAAGVLVLPARPSAAEVSRTIMELSSTGTLSFLTPEGWPLGVGARFVVDAEGVPALCLKNQQDGWFSIDGKSSFHVQLEQSGSRTPQCTLLGSLSKLEDRLLLKELLGKWEKKYGEEVDEDLLYVVSVEQVLHMEDFKEDGTWVTSVEYGNANPDPLRNCAENIVDEMNTRHSEDVRRLCNVHVDTEFQAMDTKMIWVDRLGFDMYIYSEREAYEARIPFPREVSDEKGVKSSFNCMSHLAWEVEKNYAVPESEKVKILKRIR